MDNLAFPSFLCPIGREIMRDPVNCADGHSYERASIERWLATKSTSPRTGAQLPNKVLIPNHALRNSIEEWHSTPAAKVVREATDAAVQIVKAAQADASRMRGEAEKEAAVFLTAAREAEKKAAAIIKAARDQAEETEKICLNAVGNARLRRAAVAAEAARRPCPSLLLRQRPPPATPDPHSRSRRRRRPTPGLVSVRVKDSTALTSAPTSCAPTTRLRLAPHPPFALRWLVVRYRNSHIDHIIRRGDPPGPPSVRRPRRMSSVTARLTEARRTEAELLRLPPS
jgi:hypothetical protein